MTHEEADSFESEMIAKYDSCNPEFGYNCTSGGSYGKHSSSTKEKLRARALARPDFTDKHREHIAQSRKGATMKESQKEEYSKRFSGTGNPMYGKQHSEESKRLMSEKRKNRPEMSAEERTKRSEAQKERWRKYAESKQKEIE